MKSKKGFSLLEVLISISLFTVAAMALAQAFSYQLAFNNANEIRGGAIMAAQQVLDVYRVQDPAILPQSGSSPEQFLTIGGRTYSVVAYFCEQAIYCQSNRVRQIRAAVHYQNKKFYEVQTIYSQLK